MERFIRPLGIVVAALLLAGGAGLALRSGGGEDPTNITAYFDKAIGLYENSDVTILGVAVGKVTDVQPEGDRVRVEMEVEPTYRIPADARAQIVPISVISDRFVELFPTYDGGAALEDGAVLDTDRTQSPAELDDVFKQLKKLLEAIEPGQEGEPGALGDLIVQLNRALKDREDELKGTLISGAELTQTLAQAEDDLSGLLVNLDDLFGQLATRAGSVGELNHNFAVVMTTLAQSRDDLEGTLENLAGMTNEVGSLVREHRHRLGRDLELATSITSAILRNRGSVEESLNWLPVVGENLANAHHGKPFLTTDVRDNAASARCNELDQLPGPIKDALQDLIDQLCGRATQRQSQSERRVTIEVPDLSPNLECKRSVRKVTRQIGRVEKLESVPADLRAEVIKPLKRNLRKLARECENLDKVLGDPDDVLEDLLEDIGSVPGIELDEDLQKELDEADDLLQRAAGAAVADDRDDSVSGAFESWLSDVFDFAGWSR